MNSFLAALAFLTVVPIRFAAFGQKQSIARSRFWYPIVGLYLGSLLGCCAWLVGRFAPAAPAAFVVLGLGIGLTGALHFDGLCDLCDGLFGGRTVEERLRIMKDPHLGSFGLVGGVLVLLGKYAALSHLLGKEWSPYVVGTAVLVARCLVLLMAAANTYPRSEGTGKIFVEATCWPEAVSFALVAVAVSAGLGYLAGETLDWRCWLLAMAPVCWVLVLRTVCKQRLNGVTGDCLGGAIETTELVFLLTAALLGF